ncbi:hypothetical protein MAR_004568, partial [Mya arenaria]
MTLDVEAAPTPYEGLKMEKLTAMANVMCSHCQTTDLVCTQLFCAPDQLMVDITMAILEMFCESAVKRRAADFQTTETASVIGGCYPTLEWSGVYGMDQWCLTNCKSGTNDDSCPITHCVCQTGTTDGTATDPTGATGAGLGDTC